MKNNICILCRDFEFAKKIAYSFSCDYDMIFANVDEMVQYNLEDVIAVKDKLGIDYINNAIAKEIKNISTFCEMVYTMSIKMINFVTDVKQLSNNSLIIYIDVPKKTQILNKTDKEVVIIMKEISDIQISLKNKRIKEAKTIINKEIEKYYKNILK